MPTCCLLFAKYPQPGAVKTRLTPPLSALEACRLYGSFLLDTAAVLQACKATHRVVACAPGGAAPAFRDLLGHMGDFAYQPQPDGDLGLRMRRLLDWAFLQGADRAVIIGADAPWMSAAVIDQALELLTDHDIVLGPSMDGGYYLIGLRQSCTTRPFAGIDWGSGAVLRQTIAALGAARLALLPAGYDVDTAADAAWLRNHLTALKRAGQEPAPRSLEALRALHLPELS